MNDKPKGKKPKKIISGILYKRSNGGFRKINSNISQSTDVNANKLLLNRKIKDIFSENTSSKAGEDQLDYNKILIEKITLDKWKEKTNKILDCSFLECLNHFRKKRLDPFVFKEELKGLEDEYDRLIIQLEQKDKEYADAFKKSLDGYELFINMKKPRKKQNKNGKKENDNNYNIMWN